MSIIRVSKSKDNPYVQIDKRVIQDDRLSWKAKGILSYLLSLPDDWEIYVSELITHAPDGVASLRSGMKELEDAGYLVKSLEHGKSGKFVGYSYTVIENPTVLRKSQNGLNEDKNNSIDSQPYGEKPYTEKPYTENHTLLILNNTNTDKTNIKKGEPDLFDECHVIYETKKGQLITDAQSFVQMINNFKANDVTAEDYAAAIDAMDADPKYNGSKPTSYEKWAINYAQRRKNPPKPKAGRKPKITDDVFEEAKRILREMDGDE